MTIVEKIVASHLPLIKDKRLLEIACGDSTMSLACSKVAKEVLGTDRDLFRVSKIKLIPHNFRFQKCDARETHTLEYQPDTIICFNAIGHLEDDLSETMDSCLKLLNKNKHLIIINTWKMDRKIGQDIIIPLMKQNKHLKVETIDCALYQGIIVEKQS